MYLYIYIYILYIIHYYDICQLKGYTGYFVQCNLIGIFVVRNSITDNKLLIYNNDIITEIL